MRNRALASLSLGRHFTTFCKYTRASNPFSHINKESVIRMESRFDPSKAKALIEYNKTKLVDVLQNSPEILLSNFNNQLVYVVSSVPPKELMEDGGLITREDAWHSSQGATSGCIRSSLLGEIPFLFANKSEKLFSYCFSVHEDSVGFISNSPLQVINFPGALVPRDFLVREVLEVTKEEKAILGPLMGTELPDQEKIDSAFLRFIHPDNKIQLLKEKDVGDDAPYDYDLRHLETPASAKLDKERVGHYQEQIRHLYSRCPR